MIGTIRTESFEKWFQKLRDKRAKAFINSRIRRMKDGNLGDYRPVHRSVFEMRIHYGPGYRIYFAFVRKDHIVLLLGGNKNTQQQDIKKAITLIESIMEGKK